MGFLVHICISPDPFSVGSMEFRADTGTGLNLTLSTEDALESPNPSLVS